MEEKKYSEQQWQELYDKARNAEPRDLSSLVKLDFLVKEIQDKRCGDMDIRNLARLILVLVNNPAFVRHRPVLHELATILSIEYGDPGSALANVNAAIEYGPNANIYILKIKILMALNAKEEAKQTLVTVKDHIKERPLEYATYIKQINELEARVNDL